MTAQQFASAFQCFVSAVSIKPESAESFMMLASESTRGNFDYFGFRIQSHSSLPLLFERQRECPSRVSQGDSVEQCHQESADLSELFDFRAGMHEECRRDATVLEQLLQSVRNNEGAG